MKLKAGIILISYNNQSHISDAINSIKDQSLKDWRCIIVDNGSTDKTPELIQSLIHTDDRFSVYLKDNKGPSAGRNFGFSQFTTPTEYVHFLDGDDLLNVDFLKTMTSYLDLNTEVGLLGCQFRIINSNGDVLGDGYRSRYAPGFLCIPRKLRDSKYLTPFQTFFSATGQGPFAVFRTSVFAQTSGYEEEFWSHEDSDIFCQMALLSEVHYLPLRLYDKRTHDNNLTRSPKANYKLFRDKWDYYKSDNQRINTLIEKSLIYYYTKHSPLRDFKVGFKAFREFVSQRTLDRFQWSMRCFMSGLNGFFFRRGLKHVMIERSRINN